jgi:hypothetical protein
MTDYDAEYKVLIQNSSLQLTPEVSDVFKDLFGKTDRSLTQHYIKIDQVTSRFITIGVALSNNTRELREIRTNWENKIDSSNMISENRIITSIYRRFDELDYEGKNLNFNPTSEIENLSKKADKIPKPE